MPRKPDPKRRSAHRVLILATVLAVVLQPLLGLLPGFFAPKPALAHNLQTRMVYMYMDPETQAMLDDRMADPGWMPPVPLLQVGDELGLVIKVVPRDGTTTGVGGHVDFYVPNGVQVTDVAYVIPNSSGGYTKVAMKGQSPIATGSGSISAKTTSELIGMGTRGPNVLGVTDNPVVDTTGLHRGTIAGVYGDTGIFYSTDPDTAYGSWQTFTGDTVGGCGSKAFYPTIPGKTITNNSGDVVVPCNKWDAEQLFAWGAKGTTYTSAGLRGGSLAIADYPDQRGNAPWGYASGVAGPESGYAWFFDWDAYKTAGGNPADGDDVKAGMSATPGPWKRIKYAGSRISQDVPGSTSNVIGFANVDGSSVGHDLGTTPLPDTTSQTDGTSPKAIRWAVGQLTAFRPEYVWVKIKVNDIKGIIDPSGCPVFKGDTFGGDAGGTNNGKDHLWRYYEPTEVTWNGCLATGKPATREIVKVGDTYQYKLKVYNFQNFNLTSVVVRDTLPGGVTFLSAIPAQNSGPNPLVWNVGTLLPGQKWEATVTVRATSTGFLDNCIETTSDQLPPQKVCDSTISGNHPYLVPSKSVVPTNVAAGGTVQYTVRVDNTGTGPTGNPVTVREHLPSGLTYVSKDLVTLNGANVTGPTTVCTLGPTCSATEPVFTVPGSINAGQSLIIKFTAQVPLNLAPGSYCNTYTVTQNGIPLTTGSEACITVAGGKIGDTIWRDWDGDGVQDTGEEGIAGVTVKLFASDGTTLLATTTTDANGNYFFPGLLAGTYVVEVNSGAALPGTMQTGDPDSACPGAGCDNRHTVILDTDQQYLIADFGYKPTGAASIGDKVFEDIANDGSFNIGTDFGIPNVTVWLYEDSDNNGVIGPGDALVATTTSNGTGDYLFSNLASGYNYLVKVDKTDPDIQTYFDAKYDPDPVHYQLSTPEVSVSPNLSGADLDNDFGFWRVQPGSIGDQVFIDADGDNIFDPGETPLANITVNLYLDGVLVDTTTSGPDGTYLFSNLGPGNYRVEVDTSDPDLPGGLFATVSQFTKTLAAGENYLVADFPFTNGLTKTVDKTYVDPTGTPDERTLTFTLKPFYPGDELLTNVRVFDPLPTGTSYIADSANAEGTFGVYVPLPAVPGQDTEGGPSGTATLDTAITVSTNFVNSGGSVNVTLNVKQNSGSTVSDVSPTNFTVEGGTASCTGPTPPSANVPTGPTGSNFVWNCTLTGSGEYTFSAAAENDTETFQWPEALSASVLSAPDGGPNVVTWNLGSNTAGVPGEAITSGYTAGVYAFRGANTQEFSKFNVGTNAWTTRAQPTNGIEKGGSLTNAGGGILYASEGNSKWFYSYNIATNAWTRLADPSDNFGEGGGIQYLNVGGTHYVFAVLGNSNRFRRYDIASNTWTTLAITPANVKQGGAITTDGTNLYVLRGDGKKDFWRYNVGTSDWTTLTPTPQNVKWGGALTRIGNYIYAFRGDGRRDFWRYDIAANSWASMALAPANVSDGGSLTTDGTYVYALQGKTTAFWRYNPATNIWDSPPPPAVNFNGNVGQGGALTYDPGVTPEGRFTSMVATPSLVSTGDQITVQLRLQSTTAVNNVTAGTLTVTPTGGASCSATTGPTLLSADDDIANANDDVRYQWTCTVAPGTVPGSLRFAASGSGDGSTSFPTATSNSALVSPVLEFQALVDTPSAPPVIRNTAIMLETGGTFDSLTSNTTKTYTSASIGDYVWADLDGDGVQDAGEVGLAGVRVFIDSNNNGEWDVGEPYDITDATGHYRIAGLAAGTYNVLIDPTTYPAGYVPTTDTSLGVTVTAGQQYNDADFGLQPPGNGSIGDYVWVDANNDGVQDVDEVGIPNITVRLYRDLNGDGIYDPGSDPFVAVTTTDANGNYSFAGLPTAANGNPVKYLVIVDETSTVTSPYGGGSHSLADAMDPTMGTVNPKAVELSNATPTVTNADFGYNWSGSIGDYVWWDYNANGLQDDGASGIEDAFVILYVDANNNGILDPAEGDYQIRAMLTDANGAYLFANLPPGNYLVDVYEDSMTTDGVRDVVPTTADVVHKVLGAGETYLAADFGYYNGARIQGHVWHDDDRNAIFDGGENGLGGITVYLCPAGTIPCDGSSAIATTTTAPDGSFFFVVPEGDYTLSYNTGQTTTAGYPDPTTPTTFTFHAYPGEDWQEVFDFGVDYAGRIGDRVWNDANGNGAQNLGEPGIAGVTLNLYLDADGNEATTGDQTWVAATVTDANGNYQFVGLADTTGQKYVVKVDTGTLPAGFTATGEGDPGTACGGGCDHQIATPLTGGAAITIVDFGYQPPAGTYSISGNVWNDNGDGGGTAGDGIKNGTEPNLPGVTVCLYAADGITLIVCTTTDTNGNYSFPGLPNGTYVVKVDPSTLPNGAYVQTGDPDSTCPSAGCNNQTTVTVSGANVTDKNFGYLEQRSSIAGTVVAGDGDGIAEGTDVPLAGVLVILTGSGPDGILGTADDTIQSTLTDANGDYEFTNLLPGIYQITKVDPPFTVAIADRDGGNPNNISVILPANTSTHVTGRDFEVGTSIGDYIWLDADGDGVQDKAESGIGGVTVKLYSAGPDGVIGGGDDVLIATTVTALDGYYLFEALPIGKYYVEVDPSTLPNGGTGLTHTHDLNDNRSLLINLQGQPYWDADLGYNGSPGTSILGDWVWYDVNGDSVQDPGEVGVGGVTITVTGPGCAPCVVATDPDGFWLVTGLTPGETYQVTITTPAGYTITNGDATRTYTLPTSPAMGILYADFGLICEECTATIGDRVWLDLDGDGLQDVGEPGIAGVTIDLVSGGTVIATTTTAHDGSYSFVGVPPGTYTVVVTDQANALATLNQTGDPGEAGVCVVCDQSHTLTVVAGDNIDTVDFGYAPSLSSIGNQVWRDLDGDGFFDPLGADGLPGTADDETGMAGVTIRLWLDVNNDTNHDGGDVLFRTTLTDENGWYTFSDLPAGNYLVDIVLPTGFVLTAPQDYNPDDGYSKPDMHAVTLSGAAPYVAADFGLAATTALSISGLVFADNNNNGVFNVTPDVRVPNIPVYLYIDLDGDGHIDPQDPLIATQLSDDSGGYIFTGLPPGYYIVTVDATGSRLDGFYQTTQLDTNAVQPVTLENSNSENNDFGFYAPTDPQSVPVTLAYFRADRDGDGVRFQWSTATEFGNVGFNLYELTDKGPRRLNPELIPTQGMSSMSPQHYSFEAAGVTGDHFLIEDVARDTKVRLHGTFPLGQAYGTPLEPTPIDWAGIRAEHAAKAASLAWQEAKPVAAGFRLAAAEDSLPAVQLLAGRRPTSIYLPVIFGSAGDTAPPATRPTLRLTVERDGVYRLTYEDLVAAGFDLSGVAAERIALVSKGRSVPLSLSTDGLFGPGQYLEFYGQAVKTRYTRANAYDLVLDRNFARRVVAVDSAAPVDVAPVATYLDTIEIDENKAYDDGAPAGDPWYHTSMLAYTSPKSWSFPLLVPDTVQGETTTLRVHLWGVTDFPAGRPDHHVQVFLNDQLVADQRFDGRQRRVISVKVPADLVRKGENSLRLTLPGDTGFEYDMVNLDKYSLTYPRAFEARDGALTFVASGPVFEVGNLPSADVSVYRHTAGGLVRLADLDLRQEGASYRLRFAGVEGQGQRYTVASAPGMAAPTIAPLRETVDLLAGQVDYLVIAHPSFIEGIQPLVAFHQGRGLKVRVVDVRDVYDQYGYGVFDPAAIRAYIREARATLGVRFLLLVGGDTYDYFDYLGKGSMSFIPTFYGDVWSPHVPVDQRFADTDNDGVPDLAMGRLPVRTDAELALAVGKTLAYADKDYERTAVFASDEADGDMVFSRDSDVFAASLPGLWSVVRAHMDEVGVAKARERLLERMNSGVALTSYVGHSSAAVWTFQNLFHARDVANLTNAGRPTVVLQWGCWNTYFLAPAHNTLGHEFLLNGDRGAAAVLGATTLTSSISEERLGRLVFPLVGQPGKTIGEAVLEAKIELAKTDPGMSDVLMGWTILGDPALVVTR